MRLGLGFSEAARGARAAVSQTEALDGGPNGAWDTSDAAHIPFKPVMLNSQARGAARAPGCCRAFRAPA
jgi:hypothetical protein